jgi:hypothetical protein
MHSKGAVVVGSRDISPLRPDASIFASPIDSSAARFASRRSQVGDFLIGLAFVGMIVLPALVASYVKKEGDDKV